MHVSSKILVSIIFLVLIIHIPFNVSAQSSSNGITASTNKVTYKPQEKVTITGTVNNINDGIPLTILIRNPIQNVYNVGQIELHNNIFVHEFVISNNAKPGKYVVEIKHGTQHTSLEFIVNSGLIQNIPVESSFIKVRGDEIGLIKYKNVRISTQENTITIDLHIMTTSGSSILQEFEIPKEVIDAKGQSLIVEVNESILKCSETETNTSRILSCFIPTDSRELKLSGTSVIPEFGFAAIFVLIMGIISIITISKVKLR